MAKLKTINVVENVGGVMGAIHAFSDDNHGKAQAEQMFARIVREQLKAANGYEQEADEAVEETIDSCIMDGIYEDGDYEILLTWSV